LEDASEQIWYLENTNIEKELTNQSSKQLINPFLYKLSYKKMEGSVPVNKEKIDCCYIATLQ
jgi:hypothetical protein